MAFLPYNKDVTLTTLKCLWQLQGAALSLRELNFNAHKLLLMLFSVFMEQPGRRLAEVVWKFNLEPVHGIHVLEKR